VAVNPPPAAPAPKVPPVPDGAAEPTAPLLFTLAPLPLKTNVLQNNLQPLVFITPLTPNVNVS
jgi:hypothetical protein